MTTQRRPGPGRRLAALIILSLIALLVSPATAQATSYVPIDGQGSTWDENALDQWTSDVAKYGMDVQFTGNGSSAGRTAFYGGLVDFAASDIPYGETDDGVTDPPPPLGSYAYVPIVAGGTSFMYHLNVGGRLVTNLRLSGETIAKIFTGNLTMWNAPEIAAENPGITLPAVQIVPVVRTDGSGSSAQLTKWLSEKYTSMWNAYCKAAGRPVFDPCGSTSFYPTVPGSDFINQSLDSGVAGYVAEPTSDGAITYTEYSYALEANYPVVKMLNSAGYYTLPTASNVAVSLTKASILNTPNDPATNLTQDLDQVYTDSDPRTYPLSSYSYLIVPLTTSGSNSTFTSAKGVTLSTFTDFALCQGQQAMGPLGYSPLPINLVKAGFTQITKIPGAVAQNINVATCNNPTFSPSGVNLVVQNAPQPPACDKAGPTQCGVDGTTPITTGGGTTGSGGGTGGTTGSNGATTGPSAGASGTASAGTGSSGNGSGGSSDSLGSLGNPQNGSGGAGSTLNPNIVAGQYFISSAYSSPVSMPLMGVAAGFLLIAVFGPAVYWRLRKRRRS